ncbi:QRFP-like peptide receptor isoform X2 [Onthophagus taurus]|uniref:QRFP-like peptide receptor isoform X2 n=1 Tax=Onthophagus taurus TaxID=166361 RepID=UPI000C208331|nr:QRFP-like peptide receptor isoform X2 [Onthophagus taurus]
MISTLPSIFSNATSSIIELNINSTTASYVYEYLLNSSNSSYENGTQMEYPVLPSYIRITSMVFCIVIMCLGVIGNVMVPIVIFKTKDMRNSTNIFLVNLSVADLMVLLVCTPTVLVEVNSPPETWVLGEEMCKAVPFVELTVAHASVLTILAISFERYYAICKPLEAGYICTKTRASLICLLAWVIAAVFTSPILAITTYTSGNSSPPDCRTLAKEVWPQAYFLSSIVIFFIVPLLILLVLYFIIAKTLITNAATLVLNKHIDSYSNRARKQVIMMLGTVVLSFFVCLIPFRVFTLWIIVVPEEKFYQLGVEKYFNILYFCRIMLYLNSAVNPILYNLMSSKFRTGFLICSSKRKRRYFNRSRNGTMTTTINSSRSSSSTNHQDGYRVCFHSKNNTIAFKPNESPVSNRNSFGLKMQTDRLIKHEDMIILHKKIKDQDHIRTAHIV